MTEKNKLSIFEKLFNVKRINIITIIMFIIALVIVLTVDIISISSGNNPTSIGIINLRAWFIGTLDENSYLNIIAISISFLTAFISFFNVKQTNKILSQKWTSHRQVIYSTSVYMTIGRIIEGLYLLIDTDLIAFREVILQFYITLDVLIMVLFVSMAFSLFINDETDENSAKNDVSFLIALISYIVGYIMMILYGVSPEAFAIGTYVSGLMLLLMAIVTIKTSIDLLKLRKRVTINRRALLFMAFQLILLVFGILFMIATGLTVGMLRAGNIWPNRILRIIRLTILLFVTLFYKPAYITPAKD